MLSTTRDQRHSLAELVRCLDEEADSACLLGEDWELLHVNPAWEAFGLQNGGRERNSEAVIGQSYVSAANAGPSMRVLLEAIQVHTASGEAFTLYGDCSGPAVVRRMASQFVPVPRGPFRGTAVIHMLLSDVGAGSRAHQLVLNGGELCCSCHRIRGPGERRWRLFRRTSSEPLPPSSAVCPTCAGLSRWCSAPHSHFD